MSKVKIGNQEYTINYLKLGAIKKILKDREEKKLWLSRNIVNPVK